MALEGGEEREISVVPLEVSGRIMGEIIVVLLITEDKGRRGARA